nr:RNA-directed DNA polymerase, eukaryota [Tanacetum cinerariifolium]
MDSTESKETINNHVGVRSWFSELKLPCNLFVTKERIVWISVEGFTLEAVDEKVMEINSERIPHPKIILADNNETTSFDKIGNASTLKFKASGSILDVVDKLIKRFSNNSKVDQTQKISKSVFVTNFLDHFTARDLWNVCLAYGNVIDVYIPFKKSKLGKKFAFVRFIRVDNFEHLIANLCTIWIGRIHLHANAVRFQKETKFNVSQPTTANLKSFTSKGTVNNSFADILKSNNSSPNSPIVSSPAIVLMTRVLLNVTSLLH